MTLDPFCPFCGLVGDGFCPTLEVSQRCLQMPFDNPTRIDFYEGDNRLSLRRMIDAGIRVHSVVTDPPYGLTTVTERFGGKNAAPARTEKNDGSFARLSGGFMGKLWDGSGIERDPEFWKLIYDVLLPGGYVFAFSGARTGHWQACAMETAGFVMHPMHGWLYGSGFPKAHAADKAIDKMQGQLDPRSKGFNAAGLGAGYESNGGSKFRSDHPEYEEYTPATPEAEQWDGWAYGTQAQKPALEPIYLAQKPFSEKTGAANLLKHGVGAVNIDACRVPAESDRPWRQPSHEAGGVSLSGSADGSLGNAIPDNSHKGRHPANLILDGSEEVITVFPTGKTDEGSAARFFHQFRPDMNPVFYQAKAGKPDRAGSKHPTVKPIALMRYLIRHITPPGGIVLEPFAGSGTTVQAAREEGFHCIIMEAEAEYIGFLRDRFNLTGLDPLEEAEIMEMV